MDEAFQSEDNEPVACSGLNPPCAWNLKFHISVLPFEICDLRCRDAALLLQARPSISTPCKSIRWNLGFIEKIACLLRGFMSELVCSKVAPK